MAGGVGSSERVAMTTIEDWSKMVSEETTKHIPLLSILQKKGRIEFGCSGGQFRWVVRVRDHQLKGFPDATPISFERLNTKENAYLPWRGYYAQDTITLREKFEQGGEEAMIKVFASREETIRRGITRGLADELFKDGNLAANSANESFHGIESFMGIGAQTDANAAAYRATTHNDTYGNLSTAIAGLDSAQTRVWTPTIMSTNHNDGTGQKLWKDFADEYIRKALLLTTFGASEEDRPDLILLTRDDYEALLNLLDDKERIHVARGSSLALTQLGFGNHVELDGCAIMWDASVPATDAEDAVVVRGYGFTTSRMQLKVLGPSGQKSLFVSKVTFNDSYRADNIFMHLLGNLKFESPRHFIKFADISAVAA